MDALLGTPLSTRPWLLREPARPARIRESSRASAFVVGTVCIGAFMGQLDASIVTVALPTLQRSFHASVGEVTWVGLSYLLVLVATVAAVGRFADMWGHKLLYIYGFGLFVLGSVLCGLAPTAGVLVAARFVQGASAAMVAAMVLGHVREPTVQASSAATWPTSFPGSLS